MGKGLASNQIETVQISAFLPPTPVNVSGIGNDPKGRLATHWLLRHLRIIPLRRALPSLKAGYLAQRTLGTHYRVGQYDSKLRDRKDYIEEAGPMDQYSSNR